MRKNNRNNRNHNKSIRYLPSLFIYIYTNNILNIESNFNETVTTTKCAKQEEHERNHVYFLSFYLKKMQRKTKENKKQGHLKYLNELYKMLELNNLPYMENLLRRITLLNK